MRVVALFVLGVITGSVGAAEDGLDRWVEYSHVYATVANSSDVPIRVAITVHVDEALEPLGFHRYSTRDQYRRASYKAGVVAAAANINPGSRPGCIVFSATNYDEHVVGLVKAELDEAIYIVEAIAEQNGAFVCEKPSGFLLTVVIFAAAWSIYSRYWTHAPPHPADLSAPQPEHAPPHPPGVSAPQPEPLESQSDPSDSERSPFRCDGRTYCSQMTSCAEAKYFLAHCPNVKMDGDHDGIPCERQWCPGG